MGRYKKDLDEVIETFDWMGDIHLEVRSYDEGEPKLVVRARWEEEDEETGEVTTKSKQLIRLRLLEALQLGGAIDEVAEDLIAIHKEHFDE